MLKTRKEIFCLMKKLFLFFTRFSNLISRHRSFTILSTDACILFSYFCCSLISLPKKTLLFSYKWQKFNKVHENKSQRYLSMRPECVTRKINSHILQLLWRQFLLLCCSLIKRSPNNHKRYSSHL